MSWFNPNSFRWSGLGSKLLLAGGGVALWSAGCSMDGRTLSTRADQTRAGAGAGTRTNELGGGAGKGTGGVAGQTPQPPDGADAAGADAGGIDGGGAGSTSATGSSPAGGSESGGKPSGGSQAGGAQAGGRTTTSGAGGADFGAGGCGDLDDDALQDCAQTLVDNWRFDSGATSWKADAGAVQQWDARNARPDQASSGSLLVRSTRVAQGEGFVQGGSGQCLPALGGAAFLMAARAFIPQGQGEGSAALSIWFYGADDCADYLLSSATLQTVAGTDDWTTLSGKTTTPPATRSIYVRLVVNKPFSQPSFEALFDDVLLREQ
jgi:hypothetical protein